MIVGRQAVAGTLESNDVQVSVAPHGDGLQVEVESIVLAQFGGEIERVAREVAAEMGVGNALIRLKDRGALECTVRARVETALRRAREGSA
ncbi:MAG TPA: citrate lyase acyl carrier protein [Candidatus Limnocylindria bacterium]|nr:citrate lyase acyl carrier protein [Candidatus Limnocylindria bacterium]